MTSESLRIADQLSRAFSGDPWHGSPLLELLDGVTAEQACVRPLPSGHTIWDLVLHIEVYVRAAREATAGIPMPKLFGTEKDWPAPVDVSPKAWADAMSQLFQSAGELQKAIEQFPETRLKDIVPGREYDFYYLLHGIVQHSLYHGGQIALLKRAAAAT